jgi:hypothetical protein
MAATRSIEEERGTYVGFVHQHNGYYAGDFSRRPGRRTTGLRRPNRQPIGQVAGRAATGAAQVGLEPSGWLGLWESGQTSA